MTDVFVSYARQSEAQATAAAEWLRGHGFSVWRDDELLPHRAFGDVIEERLRDSRAVLVLWTADAARSDWVRAEAEMARTAGKLVQMSLDGASLPMPFSQIQCTQLAGWTGDPSAPGLTKVLNSIAALVGRHGSHAGSAPAAILSADDRATIHVGCPADAGAILRDLCSDVVMALGRHPSLRIVADDARPHQFRLELQVREGGKQVRISARLVVTPDGEQLWSQRFEGSPEASIDFTDAAGEAIAAGVEAAVRRTLVARAARARPGESSTALAALGAVNRMTAQGYSEALQLLAPSLGHGATALALATAALCHASLWSNGYSGSGEGEREAALALARRALEAAGNDPFPTGLAAVALACSGAPASASVALADHAHAMAPSFAPASMWAGQARLIAGDIEGAIDRLVAARRLDPWMTVRPLLLGHLGAALMLADRLEEAEVSLSEAVMLQSGLPLSNLFLAATMGKLGRLAEGREILARAATIAPPADFRLPLQSGDRAKLEAGLSLL